MAGSYKAVTHTGTLAGVVGDAFSILQTLRDEMRETADNMSGANMEHTPKYEEANTAADELDNVADDEPEIPEELAELEVTYTEMVNRRKGRVPAAPSSLTTRSTCWKQPLIFWKNRTAKAVKATKAKKSRTRRKNCGTTCKTWWTRRGALNSPASMGDT